MEGGWLLSLTRVLLALVGVSALAWVGLNFLARRGVGVPRAGARLRLIERLPLSPRRQLYLVQADARVFLLGAAEGGAMSLIAELPSSSPLDDARAPLADAGS